MANYYVSSPQVQITTLHPLTGADDTTFVVDAHEVELQLDQRSVDAPTPAMAPWHEQLLVSAVVAACRIRGHDDTDISPQLMALRTGDEIHVTILRSIGSVQVRYTVVRLVEWTWHTYKVGRWLLECHGGQVL